MMRIAACVVFLIPVPAFAAPPVLDALYPPGARRGTTAEVAAAGTFSAWPVQAWADDKGIDIRPGKDKGKLSITVAVDTPPGTHWVRLYNAEGASALRPFVVGTLPEVLDKEPNDDPRKPQAVPAGVVVNGELAKAGDVDTFALPLRKGQILVAALDAARTLRSPMDGVLQVLSADGFVLEQNHDYHDLDPLVACTAPADGTYLVRVFAFPSVATASVSFAGGPKFVYRLTLTAGPFADYAYPPAVSRADPGSVELVGWNLFGSLRRLPVKPAADEETVILSHPDLASTVPVRVVTNPVRVGPQKLTLPVTVTGKIARSETPDVYPFEAKKGQKIPFRVEARALGFPLDVALRVTDSAKKVLASAAGGKKLGTDPTLDFTAPAAGTYQLEVRDVHEEGGPRHVYLLHAGVPAPDYALTVAADRFTLAPGKPLDIPVTVVRQGDFKGDVELAVEGLPPGVSATTVAGKTPALRLSGAKEPFAGPIRIVARGTPAHRARAVIAEYNVPTADLWLTIPAK